MSSELDIPEVVVITSNFAGQCMYAKDTHDGHGRRSLGLCKATPAEEAQAKWIITPVAHGCYTICSHWKQEEYLYASQCSDGHGRRFVYTWMQGGVPEDDPHGLWRIEQIASQEPPQFCITSDFQGEYLYATAKSTVFTWMKGGSAGDDPQGRWTIQAVDKRVRCASDSVRTLSTTCWGRGAGGCIRGVFKDSLSFFSLS